QFVVLLNGLERLKEDGLSARTRPVYHALNSSLLFGFNWDHEAFPANRDQFILNRAAFGQTPQVAPQRLLDQPPLFLDLTPDATQFRRSAVIQGSVGLDLVSKRT